MANVSNQASYQYKSLCSMWHADFVRQSIVSPKSSRIVACSQLSSMSEDSYHNTQSEDAPSPDDKGTHLMWCVPCFSTAPQDKQLCLWQILFGKFFCYAAILFKKTSIIRTYASEWIFNNV
jgi:hypothetical protein